MNLVKLWRRMVREDGPLRLTEMLKARGLSLPLDGEMSLRRAAMATRRCVLCAEHERCDRIIAAQDWKKLREICPNEAYIEIAATPR
jgi:hypothetical protein